MRITRAIPRRRIFFGKPSALARRPTAAPRRCRRDGSAQRVAPAGQPLPARPPWSAPREEFPAHREYPAASSARMPRTSIPPSPGNWRSSRAVWMMPAIVGGTSLAASQTWAKRNHSRGSLASSSRRESERPKWSMSTRMPAFVRFTARTTFAASARLPVSVQCGNSRLTKIPSGFARSQSLANRAVARSRSGSGNCAMMCFAPSSAVASRPG